MSGRWVVALAIAASLVVGPTAVAGPERTAAGTVVFISAQEPPNLQGPWAGNSLAVTWGVLNNIWYGCQIRNDRADFVPGLCVGRPRIVSRNPLITVHEYKQAAVWSDGRPITAKDFRATWRVFTDPKNYVISRAGWEEIKSVRGDGKQTTVVWKRP